jgi:HAD superfamily hydrolase (TIGR01549 family)
VTVDLVIFDLDGTLVEMDFTGEGMRTVRSNLQSVFERVDIDREFEPLLVDLEDALETASDTVEDETAAQIREDAFQQVAEMERDAVSRQDEFDDANGVLEQVAASESTLAVATNNTREAARAAIDAANFPEPAHLVAVDDVGHPKPNPAMIDALLERLDDSPTSVAIVGDRESDAESVCRSCEGTETIVHTVLVDRTGVDDEDAPLIDHTVTSLTEALERLPIESEETQ